MTGRRPGRLVRATLPGAVMALSSLPPQPAELLQQVHTDMRRQRVGLWLVGAFGGVGTTITLGLSAMARGLADRTGLVTELPMFQGLPLPEPGDFVVGGHDIRETSFGESAEEFRRNSGVFPAEWIAACGEELDGGLGAGPAGDELRGWAGRRPAGALGRGRAAPDGAAGRRPASPPTWPRSSSPSRSTT